MSLKEVIFPVPFLTINRVREIAWVHWIYITNKQSSQGIDARRLGSSLELNSREEVKLLSSYYHPGSNTYHTHYCYTKKRLKSSRDTRRLSWFWLRDWKNEENGLGLQSHRSFFSTIFPNTETEYIRVE